MTSRWLVAASAERGFEIRWRTFSLALLNEGRPLPAFLDTPEMRARTGLAARALRVVQAAVLNGDNEAAGRVYTEWGTRFHDQGREPTDELLREVADAAGATEYLSAADADADPAIDAAIAESFAQALELAGPDIGSPVLHVDGAERAASGPIVSPPPTGDDVGVLWDAVVALERMGSFYELKRGRRGPPALGSSAG